MRLEGLYSGNAFFQMFPEPYSGVVQKLSRASCKGTGLGAGSKLAAVVLHFASAILSKINPRGALLQCSYMASLTHVFYLKIFQVSVCHCSEQHWSMLWNHMMSMQAVSFNVRESLDFLSYGILSDCVVSSIYNLNFVYAQPPTSKNNCQVMFWLPGS